MNPLALNLLLATLWLFLSSSRSTVDFFLGWLLGFVLLTTFQAVLGRHDYARRTVALVVFGLRFLRQFIVANLNVAATVVRRRPESLQPHFFTYDVAELRLGEILILSYCITLTPGTATVQISEDQRTLILHGLDVDDLDAVRRELDRTLKAPLLRVTR
jgi:multicomponent Na+:H+ antiporter subunit E